ncbi:MAG: rhodanese-like domain-containing protein [Betaproteobacteria bacterium]|jgi:rhodanese-related sulfurtransferase|nr:rhodanese-like domain-containing protein [Betaproteobacteria bacterium]
MEAFFHFLQKDPFNMMLFGGAVATGIMLLWPLLVKPFRAGREVSVFEAVQLINRKDAVVIDVRDTGEYEAGHLANAKHVAEKQLTDRLQDLEKFKNRPMIVVCHSGMRSGTAVQVLRRSGFDQAVNMRGGIGAWQQAGMPLEKR